MRFVNEMQFGYNKSFYCVFHVQEITNTQHALHSQYADMFWSGAVW